MFERALAERECNQADDLAAECGARRAEPHPAIEMQRAAGNSAVARLLDSGDRTDARAADLAVRRTLRGVGRPLDPGTRAAMEQELGCDFGAVRVHDDSDGAASARALNARAYTVGRDVVFAAGEFDPGGSRGHALLAHELVHTVQQSGSAPVSGPIRLDSPGSSQEHAAELRTTGLRGEVALQRQPAPEGQNEPESLFTIFVAEDAKKTDVPFARDQAKKDAARITKLGSFPRDEQHLVRAKLRFFEGDAWQVYSDTIRPALVAVTAPGTALTGIGAEPPAVGGAVGMKSVQPLGDPTKQLRFLQEQDTYIDNHIKEVNYYTAELAVIHYYDGTKYELGLSPKWMKPPVVEVDYYTAREYIRPYGDPLTARFGYMNEGELAQAPRTMPYAELLKTYVHGVDFYVEQGTGRIIPSRINFLTAPTLCKVLRDSLAKWEEEYVQPAIQIGIGGTAAIGAYAGAGGLPTNTGVVATKMFQSTVTRAALSPTGRKLAREMDALLASGASKTLEAEGVQFAGVEVTRQGSVLTVRRFMSKAANPGQGMGYRMAKEFEDAAAEVGRLNGAKTVAVDVGIIINPGWRVILEARGYVKIVSEGRWVKTIKLE